MYWKKEMTLALGPPSHEYSYYVVYSTKGASLHLGLPTAVTYAQKVHGVYFPLQHRPEDLPQLDQVLTQLEYNKVSKTL